MPVTVLGRLQGIAAGPTRPEPIRRRPHHLIIASTATHIPFFWPIPVAMWIALVVATVTVDEKKDRGNPTASSRAFDQ
jgi:hypothetical protein